MNRTILDLCGGSGAWSKPYADAGYEVIVIDPVANGQTVQEFWANIANFYRRPHGILAAPPCTTFSYARNRYPVKLGELVPALDNVLTCFRIIDYLKPQWWALENPVNKLRWFIGGPSMTFYQWQYGDRGHKPTALWGDFKPPIPLTTRLRGKDRKQSTWQTSRRNADPEDAITPPGFARAFFEANP